MSTLLSAGARILFFHLTGDRAWRDLKKDGGRRGREIMKKPTGRPIKPGLPGGRAHLGLIVTSETKSLVEELARASGRTQSQMAEHLIERAIQYDRTLLAVRLTANDLKTPVRIGPS
jgi:hypothetical protein